MLCVTDEKLSHLEGLYKGPQQNTYCIALPQQLDQPGCSEKLQETHVDGVHRLGHKRSEGGKEGEGERVRQTGCKNTDGEIHHNMT